MLDLSNDDGYLKVKMGNTEVMLDIAKTQNRLADYHSKNKDKSDNEYNDGILAIMAELGLPAGGSQTLACQFVAGIQKAALDIKKKVEGMHVSQGSTASTPLP